MEGMPNQYWELERCIKMGPTPELCTKVRDFLAEHGRADPEAAHSLEDELRLAVLRVAAAGGDIAEMASICLQIDQISFPRWCA